MPPEDAPSPGDPCAWLAAAREDLALANSSVPGVGYGLLCYHAQQAAEKAFKAVLLAAPAPFPFVHDIGRLIQCVRDQGIEVPDELTEADLLTDYGTLARYPGGMAEIERGDYDHALVLAGQVVGWAEGLLEC